MTVQGPTQGTALQAQAHQRQHDLQKSRRRFGRQCRGRGNVCVTLGRQPAAQWLEVGHQGLPLARIAQEHWASAPQLAAAQRTRLETPLTAALEAQQRIAPPSRRLTQGKAVTHCNIVNAYAPTIAPLGKGKRNCPTQFGRNPGMIAEPASGFSFAWHLPVGHPGEASSVAPLVDKGQQALPRGATGPTRALHALAGALALNDPALRQALHKRGIRTVGIPPTVAPLLSVPTQEDVRQILNGASLHRTRPPYQVHIACACGYRRPVVASIIASLLCRGAARITSKGHRGAIVPTRMAVMAHNAATLVRIQDNRLSKRAQKLCRWLCLKR